MALEEVGAGRPWSISRGIPAHSGHSGSFQLIPAQESQRPESQAAWEALTSCLHHCSRETGPRPGLLGQVPWASLSAGH